VTEPGGSGSRPGETERGEGKPPSTGPERRPGETERGGKHWFEDVAATLGTSYLRYSFTRGTAQEVEALIEMLGIQAGQRILDVGCGPGRHTNELGRRGFTVHGIDISERFIELAGEDSVGDVTFEVADAMTWRAKEPFDVAISLCQGAFGLAGGPGSSSSVDPDTSLLANIASNLVLGGRLGLSAFSAYFQVANLTETDDFDADRGVNHEWTTIRDEKGGEHPAELWTTCLTPRELRLMARAAGLRTDTIYSARPGRYERRSPTTDSEEFLLLATRVDGGWVQESTD